MTDDLLDRLRSTGGDACRCGTPVCLEAADRIKQLEADLEVATMKRLLNSNRIEQLEAALDDMSQYVSRADWHYLNPETIAALEETKDD
jgi:hypothetical protein